MRKVCLTILFCFCFFGYAADNDVRAEVVEVVSPQAYRTMSEAILHDFEFDIRKEYGEHAVRILRKHCHLVLFDKEKETITMVADTLLIPVVISVKREKQLEISSRVIDLWLRD